MQTLIVFLCWLGTIPFLSCLVWCHSFFGIWPILHVQWGTMKNWNKNVQFNQLTFCQSWCLEVICLAQYTALIQEIKRILSVYRHLFYILSFTHCITSGACSPGDWDSDTRKSVAGVGRRLRICKWKKKNITYCMSTEIAIHFKCQHWLFKLCKYLPFYVTWLFAVA